ncbi:Protein CBG08907 [Caenorhabditis briggsae]|uniref:Protein CBG08907 n=1 Tax=Caenorhabditis briggsae TaxID=6238 RepID=A8X7N3_CAEBR|nr:Protein CBG08907 [Caenorhabditis briggsae]CAP28644.2 Protein CBG08907 [Caenorhabditis briggsae]
MKRGLSPSSPEDHKKIRSSQETSDESAHHDERMATTSNKNPENPSSSNNAPKSIADTASTGNPSFPVKSLTSTQEMNQSPGYAYEPPNVDKANHPDVLELITGEKFFVRGVFGNGGFCTVFRARDQNNIQYAAKLIAERIPEYPTYYELLAHEKILHNPHQNLISFVVNGMLAGPPPGFTGEIIVTEGARQDTNKTYYPSFCMENIRHIGSQIAKAMAHLESLKIFHLDLKAGNVFVKPDIQYTLDGDDIQPTINMDDTGIKVIDLGNSASHWEPWEEKKWRSVQPPALRSPEVMMGLPYNEKSDVWSMGCLLAEMFVGQFIFYPTSGTTEKETNQSQFELTASRLKHAVPIRMIQESQRGGHCELDYRFLNQRPPNNRDQLMNIMREEADIPLYHLLQFMLIIDPNERPSFEDVVHHDFFEGI